MAEKLKVHGLSFQKLDKAVASAPVEVFRATETKLSPRFVEGHQGLAVKGSWAKEAQPLPTGTLYVPAAQPGVELVAHLFEPLGPDSLVSWGFFNNHFEQKEYIEDYVVEPFARELLAKDPAVKAAFEEKMKDPAFAKEPRARLRFFAERHPSWDARFNLYPVYRTDAVPAGLVSAR